MITVIPRRYDSPKWQANVPVNEYFHFSNGLEVRNLYELKQALSTLPEDILKVHVNPERHDIAEWVKYSVGDITLSDELRPNLHRWGMIVTLERHLMRTLNLPPYVGKRWLAPVTDTFTLASQYPVTSIPQLLEALNQTSDDAILKHCERIPNDIAKWVNDSVGDYPLAEILAESTNRSQMSQFIQDHLVMLEDAIN